MYHVLASAVNHPDSAHPYRGLFNQRSLQAITGVANLEVVSPRPFAPPVGPHSAYASLPDIEPWGTYDVHRPKFLYMLPKRLFYGLSGHSFQSRIPTYVEDTFGVPDVVHACHIYIDGYGLLPYAQTHDVPLFVVAHGTIINTLDDQPTSVRSKVLETLNGADGVLAVSDALASKVKTLTDPEKVSTVPLGADPSNFPVERAGSIRGELSIDTDATVVLFVGRFSGVKGIPELLEAVPAIKDQNVEFLFVGHGGDLGDSIKKTLGRFGRSSRHVHWQLPPLAVRRLFAIADLLVLPSHREGRPTVIYEAMASQTAVLATNVGGIPEQVVDGETGFLVPPADVGALASALRELVEDPDRLDVMGDRGLERLLKKGWTWREHARRVRDHHKEVLS